MNEQTKSAMTSEGQNAEDSVLVQASRLGDLESFNRLVDQYQGLVYNLALRMLHEPSSAEDVAQETFLSAYEHIQSFRGGSFRAWLLRIAINACNDMFRRTARRPQVSLEQAMDYGSPTASVPDPTGDPEEFAVRRERQQVLARLLMALPPDQRAVVVLSDVHGLSYEEIAAATNEALGTVKSRLSRGRVRLRDLLRDQGELFPLPQRHNNEG